MLPTRATTVPSGVGPEPFQASTSGPADTSLAEAILTIRKRKWLIIFCTVLGICYGFYKGSTQPHIFISVGTIQIRSGSANEYRLSSTVLSDSTSHLANEVAILRSDTLLLSVAADLDLANNWRFMGAKGPYPHRRLEDPVVRQSVLDRLGPPLVILTLPKTDIIRIEFSSLDPQMGALIVNTLIDDYRARSSQVRIDFSESVSRELTPQLDKLKQDVETAQERVIELQKRIGILGLDASHNQVVDTLDELSKATSEAEVARILAESRYKVLSQMDLDAIESSVDAPLGSSNAPGGSALSLLRSQLSTVQVQYAQLMAYLGPKNPQAVALQNQINSLQNQITAEQKRLVEQARENYLASRSSESQTAAALSGEKQDAYKLRDDLVAYTLAQRDYESDRTLYESLLQKLRTATISAGLESNEIDIIDRAYPPMTANLQRRSTIALLSGLSALVIGLILAFILEALDTSLSSVTELESMTGLPSLAMIPRARRSETGKTDSHSIVKRNITSLTAPKSQFAESFRALRTSLLLSTAGHPPKVILLTSAAPSEGKTTVSINLACVFAQSDARILLIDGDLRRPTVHHRFGLNGKIGLTTVLTGASTLEKAVQKVPELPNLDILTSGPVPPFPTEMLSSDTMQELLKRAEDIYTHIIIDSPPLLSVTDGVVLSRSSDAVVLIVRQGKSNKNVVRRARDLIQRAGGQMTGLVMNAVDLKSPEYYGYHGYYGYSGYSYAGADPTAWSAGESSAPKEPAETEQQNDKPSDGGTR